MPIENSYRGLTEILGIIAESGKCSFLAVLKLHSEANDNWLSFPLEGYSLALDFKIQDGLYELLDQLDKLVVHFGGRIYLAKDSRVSKEVFEQGYPQIKRFRQFRKSHKMQSKFKSLQSQRLAL